MQKTSTWSTSGKKDRALGLIDDSYLLQCGFCFTIQILLLWKEPQIKNILLRYKYLPSIVFLSSCKRKSVCARACMKGWKYIHVCVCVCTSLLFRTLSKFVQSTMLQSTGTKMYARIRTQLQTVVNICVWSSRINCSVAVCFSENSRCCLRQQVCSL